MSLLWIARPDSFHLTREMVWIRHSESQNRRDYFWCCWQTSLTIFYSSYRSFWHLSATKGECTRFSYLVQLISFIVDMLAFPEYQVAIGSLKNFFVYDFHHLIIIQFSPLLPGPRQEASLERQILLPFGPRWTLFLRNMMDAWTPSGTSVLHMDSPL